MNDPNRRPQSGIYVEGVIGASRTTDRVLAWDVWNEPDNPNDLELRRAWSRRTRSHWSPRCCPRSSPGRARDAEPAADQRRLEGRLVDRRRS